MKRLLLLTTIILVACGPSTQEKEEIAIITCNVMGLSGNMDGAVRIKEINAAREQIGEDRFLGSDDAIKESFKYGLCKELVLNDPGYNAIIEEVDALVKIETEKAPGKYRDAMLAYVKDYKPSITHIEQTGYGVVYIDYTCLNGLFGFINIKLRNNIGTIIKQEFIDDGRCDSDSKIELWNPGNVKGQDRLIVTKENLKGRSGLHVSLILSVEMAIQGSYKPKNDSINVKLSHPYFNRDDVLEPPIVIPMTIDVN